MEYDEHGTHRKRLEIIVNNLHGGTHDGIDAMFDGGRKR
jgi:hypothetical protein